MKDTGGDAEVEQRRLKPVATSLPESRTPSPESRLLITSLYVLGASKTTAIS
ncbi:MAG: hypothetical protein AB1422_12900 [bacterium]